MYSKIEAQISKILKLEGFNVGDIVEIRAKQRCEVLKIEGNKLLLLEENSGTIWWFDYVTNLIHRNITLPMILRAYEMVRKFHTHLEINSKGYLTYWESPDEDKTKQVDWILRKDGKDVPLFNQSEQCKKFIYEVLEAGNEI